MNLSNGLKNIVFSIVGQIVTLGMGILIPRFVIVSYGSEYNGLLSSIAQVISYLSLLEAGVAMASSQALYKPIAQDDKKQINSILATVNHYYKRTGTAYLLFVIVIAIVYPLAIQSEISYGVIFLLALINGVPGVINYYFQGKYRILIEAKGESYVITNVATILSVVASVMKIILLYFKCNIILVQLVYCATSLFQMIYVLCYIKKRYNWVNLKVSKNRDALNQKGGALMHQICGLVTNSTDVMLLTFMCDLGTVSIYSLYNMIFSIISNVTLHINSGVQYILGQTYSKSKELYTRVIDAYEIYYIAISSALYLVAYILILPFFSLYTKGADINYLNPIYPLLFLIVKFFNTSRYAACNTASISGNFKSTQKHAIIESIINLIVSLASVRIWGICGVLCGTIVALTYRCIVSIQYANVEILHRSPVKFYRTWIVNGILLGLMAVLLNYINWYTESYFVLILYAIILTVLCLIIFIVINSVMDLESFKLVFNVITKRLSAKFHKEKKHEYK